MSDDEQKKDETTEEPQAEETPATEEPQAEETPATEEPQAEEAPAAEETPAEEAPAAEAEEAPLEDGGDAPAAGEDAPAAEEAPSEPNPEDDLPWKERRRLQKSRRPIRKALPSDTEERKALRAEERKRKAELRRKQRAAAKTAHTAGSGTPPAESESNAAKVRQGIVVSSKGDKSITVRIDTARRHRTYEKIVRSSTKLHAHDERNEAGEGDVVRVIETRPLSKTKRWRLVDVVEKAR
jgi:small subunit ribosomal protein S17